MATISLDKQIEDYLPFLGKEEKQSLLSVIKSFMKLKETDIPQPHGQRPTIEQYNKEIDEAMARVNNGEFYTQEEVEEMSKKW